MLPNPELLQHLGYGVCLLGSEDEIIEVSPVWRQVFEAQNSDLSGRQLADFFVNPEDARKLRLELMQQPKVHAAVYQMKRANGEWFYGEITARALINQSGLFEGQEALVRDVTQQEVRGRIVEWLPVGFYTVQVHNRHHTITYCNQTFAEMFGFTDRQQALGYEIAQLYQRRQDFEEFVALIVRSKDDNNTRPVYVKSVDGRRFVVEATVKWDKNRDGEPVARYGLVRDLTHDMPLKELRANLVKVLHTYTNNQIPLHFALQAAIDLLGPSPFDPRRRPPEDGITEQLATAVNDLAGALKIINDHLGEFHIDNQIVEGLFELEDALEYVKRYEIPYQLHAWLDIARKAQTRAGEAHATFRLPEKALNSLLINAAELERLTLLVLLINRDADYIEIGHEVRSFSEYLNAGERTREGNENELVDLVAIVKQACGDLGAFAITRGITIDGPRVTEEMKVRGNKRDMLRVISNIIHNAVKYSWGPRRGEPGERVVNVRLSERRNSFVLRVTNLGVRVPQDELQLIFSSGYRGRLATERGRAGTGVGLTDAKTVIENCGGTIGIESKPVSGFAIEGRTGEAPHLTTLWVTLPRFKEKS